MHWFIHKLYNLASIYFRSHVRAFFLLCSLLALCGCLNSNNHNPFNNKDDETRTYDLEDIQNGGELIILTLYGANSYFDFHGEDFGYQYRLAENFAEKIGTSIRVEVMHDEIELVGKFLSGEGDMIAYNLHVTDSLKERLLYCGEDEITAFVDSLNHLSLPDRQVRGTDDIPPATDSLSMAWAVRTESPMLAEAVSEYLAVNQPRFHIISRQVKDDGRTRKGDRHYTPRINAMTTVLDPTRGIISPYDDHFRTSSVVCDWDWRLLAAQAYQESGFDSHAVSRAGARGVMQIMPRTARGYGINPEDLFSPSSNIKGAVSIIRNIDRHYSDISDRNQRVNFVLAAYNGGMGHIDDARRLARKKGRNPDVWNGNVDEMVLSLMTPDSYRDPVVQYGYMRGSETYQYVRSIRSLWEYYRSIRVSSPD